MIILTDLRQTERNTIYIADFSSLFGVSSRRTPTAISIENMPTTVKKRSPFVVTTSFCLHLEPIYPVKIIKLVASLFVREIAILQSRLDFKLKTAILALLAPSSLVEDAISLQTTSSCLVGFAPTRSYNRKAQFDLYKT